MPLLTVNPPQDAVSKPPNRCFVLSGKGIYGFFTDKQDQAASSSDKNLPAVLRPESIFLRNLVYPKPYTIYAPETKTTDSTERRIKKMSDSQRGRN